MPDQDVLTQLTKRLLGPDAEFWQSRVKKNPEFRSELEQTLAPGETRSRDELLDMLKGVWESAAMAAVPGVGPHEVETRAPAARRRPSTAPTRFSAEAMDLLSPEQQGRAREAARPSELRYELKSRQDRDKELRAKLTQKPTDMDAIQHEAQDSEVSRVVAKRRLNKLMADATPDQMAAAVKQAKSIAGARRQAGFPWKGSYDKALEEALTVGAAGADEAFARSQGPFGGKAPDSVDLGLALEAIKGENNPSVTSPRETPQAFTQPEGAIEMARRLAAENPVTPAKNQAEVDTAHEVMLNEFPPGPELDMSFAKPQQMIQESTNPRNQLNLLQQLVPEIPSSYVGALDQNNNPIGALKVPPRSVGPSLADFVAKFMSERDAKKAPAPKPIEKKLTRAEWLAKRKREGR